MAATAGAPAARPLARAFPALASLARAPLASPPTPVARVDAGGGPLWVKRDDLTAGLLGGSKVRPLEFLLAGARPGQTVLTIGGVGSTHILTTATYARALGLRVLAVRWPHEMNALAHRVAARAGSLCDECLTARSVPGAMARAAWIRARRPVRYVPFGGSSPLGILGHVEGALELAEQVAAGVLPEPARLVVPLGSGGTAAGLAVGLTIAGLGTTVVAARVGPRPFAGRWRVMWLARRTSALLSRLTGARVAPPPASRVVVTHEFYGGAYGRPLAAGDEAAALLGRQLGVVLDATYSAKGAAAALALARGARDPTLLWLTFDGRWLRDA